MAPEDTALGRALLELAFDTRDQVKLDEFYSWLDAHANWAMHEVRKTFNLLFTAGDKARALKLYDTVMEDSGRVKSGTRVVSIGALFLAACLGAAVVYLYELLRH
jgi:hypothetical protein